MIDRTPYDEARSRFSRRALARLALSAQAYGMSERSGQLAATGYDDQTGPGGRVSEAVSLTEAAAAILTRAVIFERERGASWAEISRYLDMTAAEAEERFTPAIEEWESAFDEPYRLDETGRKRIPRLPTAAYDPERAIRSLDLWARVRLGFEEPHPISVGLDPAQRDEDDDASVGDVSGVVPQRNLRGLLGQLAAYVPSWPYLESAAGWQEVQRGLETDGNFELPLNGPYRSILVRLERLADDEVSVLITGLATSPDLCIQATTLLDVLAAD